MRYIYYNIINLFTKQATMNGCIKLTMIIVSRSNALGTKVLNKAFKLFGCSSMTLEFQNHITNQLKMKFCKII
jgi:hypothetical protein